MKKLVLYFIIQTWCLSFIAASRVFIIIHGTWAANTTWYQDGGDFFGEICKACAPETDKVISFTWSGKLDNKSRMAAGKELAKQIRTLPVDTIINIIGHSHGANVGIIACQQLGLLKYNRHKIDKFYALAPPVNTTEYMPNMDIIRHFYNFFSLQDYVQPVLGIFGRTYPEHPRIVNIRVILEDKSGSHSQMHDPMIAQWIPYIHEHLAHHELGNFDTFAFGKPGVMYFFNDGHPYYKDDKDRDKLLELDKYTNERIIATLSRSRKNTIADSRK